MRIQKPHRILHYRGCLILAAALCLVPSLIHSAGNHTKTVAHYTVTTRGFDIGDVTTTQRSSEEGGVVSVHFETRTAVKASFLWMGYSLDTTEKGTLQKGDMVRYSRKGREDDDQEDPMAGFLQHIHR